MIFVRENGVRVLTPDSGGWLSDGHSWSQNVSLGVHANPDNWVEYSQAEYEAWLAAQAVLCEAPEI